jgi:hypothetical protein
MAKANRKRLSKARPDDQKMHVSQFAKGVFDTLATRESARRGRRVPTKEYVDLVAKRLAQRAVPIIQIDGV